MYTIHPYITVRRKDVGSSNHGDNPMRHHKRQQTTHRNVVTVAQLIHRECSAYNKACNNCGKLGHFSKVCRSPKISKVIQDVHGASDSTSECDAYIGMEKSSDNDKTGTKWSENLCVIDKLLNFKLDPGSGINIIYKYD